MKKENILTREKIQVAVTEEAMQSLEDISVESDHPELTFQAFSSEPGEEEQLFVIGASHGDVPFALPLEDLIDPLAFWDFKRRILAARWLDQVQLETRQDLYEAWYILKFLCQEIRNPHARVLGREMADLDVHAEKDVLEIYRQRIRDILRLPSSPNRIRNSLWKNYTNQLKKSRKPLERIKAPDDPTGKETLLSELRLLEDEALSSGLFFGTSPVIYRSPGEGAVIDSELSSKR